MNRSTWLVAAAGLTLAGYSLLLAQASGEAGSHADEPTYGLESRAAIAAHHLCAGLWVVGRVTKRAPEEILAQDIAPFKDFSWDRRFTYSIDRDRQAVTVTGPGIASRTARYS